MEEYELFVSCLAGLEKALAAELKSLGLAHVRPLGGGVAAAGGVSDALRTCLWSRIASRVMLVVGRANAGDANLLYEGACRMPWEDVLADGATFAVRAHGTNENLRNTKFTALKVKDAVCDRLLERCGKRPDVDPRTPDMLIDVRVRDNRATVSIDLSGDALSLRDYVGPDAPEDAALSCSLAAGLLALAGWDEIARNGGGLVDPACGEGFLLLEAASAACDLAPALTREKWGFRAWRQFDEAVWSRLLEEADERFERGLSRFAQSGKDGSFDQSRALFVGLSGSSPAIARARARVKRACLRGAVSVEAVSTDGAEAVVERTGEAVRREAAANGAKPPACPLLIASVLRADEAMADATLVADAATFAAASAAAPVGSRFAVAADGGAVTSRFPSGEGIRHTLGRGRIETEAAVFSAPPASDCIIGIPDSAGGAEHALIVRESTSDQFAARLRKNAKERRKWARREGVFCYRVYDADLPDYNAAIDVYEGAGEASGVTFLHVAEYQAPSSVDAHRAHRRFEDILAIAPIVLGVRPDHVFSKVRRREKGGGQYREARRRSYVTWTQEDGCLFELDLAGYVDTGLFLDHRLTRELVGSLARGARFLNLFAYTGSATVHAAKGGAVETTTVDLSATYLDWAWRNMELNGFTGSEHSFVRADVMDFITQTRRSPQRFDLVFADPPTFSNSKAMGRRTWDVQRDHVELLIGVTRLLSEGGLAVFSCNLRTFRPDVDALAKYGVALEDITAQTIPHDFERNPKIHKCYLARRV